MQYAGSLAQLNRPGARSVATSLLSAFRNARVDSAIQMALVLSYDNRLIYELRIIHPTQYARTVYDLLVKNKEELPNTSTTTMYVCHAH